MKSVKNQSGTPKISKGSDGYADLPGRAELPFFVEIFKILQVFRLGDLAIAAAPCEIFVEIGLAIKSKSPFKTTFTTSLANGYNGYLPTPEHHKLGGYETWRARSSYLEVDASNKVTPVLFRLLHKLKNEEISK